MASRHKHSDDIRPPKAPGTRATEKKPQPNDDRAQPEDEDLSAFVNRIELGKKPKPN